MNETRLGTTIVIQVFTYINNCIFLKNEDNI